MKSTLNLKAALAGAVSLGSLLLCTMSWAPAVFAADTASVEVVKLDPKLMYKETSETDQSTEANSFLADVIVKFASHDLYAIPMEGAKGPNLLSLTRSDIAFGNESLDHLIFVKTGVKLSDDKAVGKLLRMPHGVYGYHKVTKGGLPVAVIFTGFTEQEAVEMASSVVVAANSEVHPSSFVATVFNSLVPSACAATKLADCLSPSRTTKIDAAMVKSIVDKVMADTPAATAGRAIVECATSYAVGALFSTKPGAAVGTAMIAGTVSVGLWEGAKHLYNDWSGSVAKSAAKIKQTAAVISSTMKEIQAEAEKHDKGSWTKLLKAGEIATEFACGIWGGLPKGALVKALNGGIDKLSIREAFAKMAVKDKFAGFFGKKAAAATLAAATVVAPVAVKEAHIASEAKAVAAASAEGKAVAKTTSLVEAPAAAEVAAPVSFASNTELKSTLVKSGVTEFEAAPVLETISKISKGNTLDAEDRVTLIQAMRSMKPEQQKAFEQQVYKVMGAEKGALPATNTAAAKITAKHKMPDYRPKLVVEFKHAERAVQVSSDPTLYPSLHKLSLVEKDEVAVADVIASAEERGIPAAKIDKAVEDAGAACKVK